MRVIASDEGVGPPVRMMDCDGALEGPQEAHPHPRAVDDGEVGVGVCQEEEEKEGPRPLRRQSLNRPVLPDRSPPSRSVAREPQL